MIRPVAVAVIGGGLAGSAAACHLAKAGRSVVLFEKEAAPHHKVCGEFISAEAQAHLRDLGVDIAELGAATIQVLRLAHRERSARVGLPFPAAGFSRSALDEHLLNRARALGVDVRRGAPVRTAERRANGGWLVTAGHDEATAADKVFLATGKHELRPFRRVHGGTDECIGFKMHFRAAGDEPGAARGAVEMVLFDGGYAGLLRIDGGTLNLCLLIGKPAFARLNKSWPALLDYLLESSPTLAARLAGAAPCWDEPLAIASLPFGYLCDERQDGFYRLGDQACVIPSFCGSGISIALHTARLASEFVVRGRDAAAYHRRVRRDLSEPLRLAAWLSSLAAQAWTRNLAVQTCRAFPAAISLAAAKTRIPSALAD